MGIRKETLRPASSWAQANGQEVKEVLRLAGFTGLQAAEFLGLSKTSGDRTIRRWTAGTVLIPYTAWALLVERATGKKIW